MNLFPATPVTFAHPWLLLLLLALPLVALFEGGKGAAPAVMYSSLRPIAALGKARRFRMGGWLLGLLLLALALLVVALARPRQGRSFSQVQASGIDIMIALDVSGSMIAEDLTIGGEQASRIDVVKHVARQFIEARPNDRIGMMAFAGRPYLVSPLTLDHGWLLQNLDRVQAAPKFVEDGTAIGSAIASCTNRLIERKDSKSRIVVLLTDGENNSGKVSPLTAAEAAKALGVKVYTIGAGTTGYAPFPQYDMFGRKYYGRIKADVDEVTLKKIANLTNAEFYRATNTKTLTQVFERIDQLEKTTIETKQYTEYRELFPWLLGAGLGVLAIQALAAQTLGSRLP
jgi:Ca-activated chloride channel family protein